MSFSGRATLSYFDYIFLSLSNLHWLFSLSWWSYLWQSYCSSFFIFTDARLFSFSFFIYSFVVEDIFCSFTFFLISLTPEWNVYNIYLAIINEMLICLFICRDENGVFEMLDLVPYSAPPDLPDVMKSQEINGQDQTSWTVISSRNIFHLVIHSVWITKYENNSLSFWMCCYSKIVAPIHIKSYLDCKKNSNLRNIFWVVFSNLYKWSALSNIIVLIKFHLIS